MPFWPESCPGEKNAIKVLILDGQNWNMDSGLNKNIDQCLIT